MEKYEIKHVFVTSNVVVPTLTETGEYTVYLPTVLKDVYQIEILQATYFLQSASVGIYLDIQELRNPVFSMTASGASNLNSITGSTFAVLPGSSSSSSYINYNSTSNYPIIINYSYPLQKIDRFTVKWTDLSGNRLTMGTKDNSVLLKIYTLRKNAGPR
jgi:hypothetical protein